MFGARERRSTGIHIAGSELRVVELARSRGKPALRSALEVRLEQSFDPVALGENGRQQELIRALQAAGDRSGVDFAHPCVALNARTFFLKELPLINRAPKTRRDHRENREHLLWEVGQFLDDQRDFFSIDFALTDDRAFAVVARRSVLDMYIKVFARAGIDDLDFDIESFALYNCAEGAGLLAGEGIDLLVDPEASRAVVLLVENGVLRAVRCFADRSTGEPPLVDLVEGWISGGRRARAWVAGAETRDLRADLEGCLAVECASFSSFAGIDTGGVSEMPAVDSAYAVAVGLAYRRLNG